MQLKKAVRKQTRLKIGISAPSGAGKTYSSLLLAKGLCGSWDKICVIDSENGSASLYTQLGEFNTIELAPPYDAQTYIKAIKIAQDAGMEVVIIDSLTHFWDYVLEYQNKLGGKFQDWAKANPVYQSVVDAILQSPMHVIVCSRRKTAYEVSTENGKSKVQKIGTKVEMRDSFEYELTLSFSLSQSHLAEAEKDRTGLFAGKPEHVISEKTGEQLRAWADSGEAAPTPVAPTVDPRIESMVAAFAAVHVTRASLEERVKGPLKPEHLDEFRAIYNDITEKKVPASKFFKSISPVSELNQRLGSAK
jgi:hypothetical protein